MAFLRIQHVGVVVEELDAACRGFERLFGLRARDFRDDQGKGMQLDARILLGNECWLHLVQNWDERSRVNRFLRERGEGLEHIAIETDDIEGDVEQLRAIGVPIFEDRIFPANDGYEAFVFPDQLPGLTVELIQGHDTSWVYPDDAVGEAISDNLAVVDLAHLGLAVHDVAASSERFERLFGLRARAVGAETRGEPGRARIDFRNDCWLDLYHDPAGASPAGRFLLERGEGLDHMCLRTSDIDADVDRLASAGAAFFGDGIVESEYGRSATVWPATTAGITVELLQAPAPGLPAPGRSGPAAASRDGG